MARQCKRTADRLERVARLKARGCEDVNASREQIAALTLSQRIVNIVQERFRLWNKYCHWLTTIYSVKDKTDTVNEREQERHKMSSRLVSLASSRMHAGFSTPRREHKEAGMKVFFFFSSLFFQFFFCLLHGSGG